MKKETPLKIEIFENTNYNPASNKISRYCTN